MKFFNSVFYKFLCSFILNLYGYRRLGIAHFDKGLVYNSSILSIFECTSNFTFSSRGNDIFEDFAKGMDRTIEFGLSSREVGDEVAEKEVATYSTFGVRFDKVYSITMYP